MSSRIHYSFALFIILLFMGSCSISNQSMKSPNYHIEFYKTDFEYSEQLTAEATSVRILMIDWKRLLRWKTGDLSSDRFNNTKPNISVSGNLVLDYYVAGVNALIPVLGDYGKGKVSNYALYNLMQDNPGYDIVIYPQYETKRFIIPVFYSKRTVKVRARLGKIK